MGVIIRQLRRLPIWLALILPISLIPSMEAAQATLVGSDFRSETRKERALEAYMKLPLYFVANQGQVDERLAYYVQGGGHSIYFTAEEVVMALRHGSGQALDESVLRLRFVGANATQPVGVEKTAAKVHYFIGRDPAKWRTDIPTYSEIVYRDLYPDVDLRYGGQNGALKYTFVVNPGADPAQIRLAYQGVESLRIAETGDLIIETAGGELRDTKPSAYQEIGERRVEVEVAFEVRGSSVYGFALRGDYDPRYPVIIDPTLLYSTYLGGSDDDYGWAIAVDRAGHAYVTGETHSTDFPTQNPCQGDQGDWDAFIAKIDTTQSGAASLLYSTYLGGSHWDYGHGIAVDEAGHAYVTGYTYSIDFPTQNPYQEANAGVTDAFVTKLNAAGNVLLYSTYLGGSDWDHGRGIAVDGAGHAYVTSDTWSIDFPTRNPYDNSLGGSNDAFVTKIDTTQSGDASLLYSTYLGGSGYEYGWAIAVDGEGKAYVTGNTASTDFSIQNPYQGDQGGLDAFVTKLNAAGDGLVYSTYLGGSSGDYGTGIAVDGEGNAYVTGNTESIDFPTQNEYQGDQPGTDVFVTKLNAAGDGLVYSTYLGGGSGDYGMGIAVDGAGHAYVTGHTYSIGFPTQNPYQKDQEELDAFVTKLNAAGSALVYSTYLGGSERDFGLGIAMDGVGNTYVTGYTYSTDFPTQNPYQGDQGGLDAFVTKFGLQGPITPTLAWNDQTEDKVRLVDGAGGLTPDGQADGSFVLVLDLGLGVSKDIVSLVMTSTQHIGVEWNTIPGDGKSVLGVSTGGPLLNNPADGSFTQSVTSTASFLIYGSDVPSSHPLYSFFPPEMYTYQVTVHFSDGSSVWAEAQIPLRCQVYLPIILKGWTLKPSPTPPPPPTPLDIRDVDVNPETNHVYVASTEWDRVFDIDAAPSVRGVVDVIGVGNGPTGLAVLQPLNKVYVAHQYDWEIGVSRIDADDNNARYDIGHVGAAPIKLADNPITMRVYVSNYYEKKTAVIDGVTDNFLYYIQKMEVAQGSYGIEVDRVTDRIFVATRDAGELALIDGAAAEADPKGYVPVFIKPPQDCSLYMVGVNPSKGHVFVTCPESGKVFVLDESLISLSRAQMMVTAEGWEKFVLPAEAGGWIATVDVPSGTGAEGIAVNPITDRVYVTNHLGNFVVVIQDSDNPASITQLRTVSVGDEPQGVGVNTQTNRIYVGNSRSGNISELDGNNDDKEILPRIPLPSP